MHYIKLALISFIFLFVVVTGISLFFPSEIRILKSINIRTGRDPVMIQLKNPANWKNWYPGLDSTQLLYENGIVKGVVLKDKDSTRPVYIRIDKEELDQVTTSFTGGSKKNLAGGWRVSEYPGGDSVLVEWYMDFHFRWYPWEKFSSLLLERTYGFRMQQGLVNLKKLVQPE
jgi:polyketide cyclase/dehydrase/lipid transport protein